MWELNENVHIGNYLIVFRYTAYLLIRYPFEMDHCAGGCYLLCNGVNRDVTGFYDYYGSKRKWKIRKIFAESPWW